ncbi:polyphosphate kinase 2 family protein [Chlorobium sp. BLA1]|uniref:ADP-polyphosphate phosphotransferase n=1 Tax=Candidatus Chlorobium masyuteum TaxID=2716876 RepID=UPI0014243FF8|nr:ADP-polyphosphate phosphotransferase [Candidatus Chlorobium masyuteum]NHQ59028.1 polyphosphate kinase 2 family protein [Candidatus Chlorobium masyuteum]
MHFDCDALCVPEGGKVNLSARPTRVKPIYSSREEYKEMLAQQVEQLRKLQNVHYADNRFSLLLIFQAMDAAGKDSIIRHVMTGVNPQGCQVFSFKHPSPEELEHDFLWRSNRCLPERGHIGIFNRSYYEEVLIVRVHPEILSAEGIADEVISGGKIWEHRYRSIVDMETHLYRNGTRTVKFFLHLSKAEQRKRFLSRIDAPEKNWKLSMADIEERKYWDGYMKAYEACLGATSTKHAPWYVVPADDKANARLIVSRVILDTLESLDLSYPLSSESRQKELLDIREQLKAEEDA